MKIIRTLVLIALIHSCKVNNILDEKLISVSDHKYVGKDSLCHKKYPNGNVRLKGRFAINNKGELTTLKVGKIEEYYENGSLKSEGWYEIGKYTQCCFVGFCSQYYNYKLGKWKYYYESGIQRALVKYEVHRFPIKTSCEGGDQIKFGQINTKMSKLWNLDEEEILFSEEDRKRYELVITSQHEYLNDVYSLENGVVKFSFEASESLIEKGTN